MKPNLYKPIIFFFILAVSLTALSNQLLAQIITNIAGDGYTNPHGSPYGRHQGDGGPATQAELSGPFGVVVDDSGNVYIAEHYNYDIRKINAVTGIITTIDDTTASYGFSGDGGPAILATNRYATGIALDDSGNIYYCDLFNNRIRKVTKATGIVTTVIGNGGQGYSGDNDTATKATIDNPYGVTVDHKFNIYFTDTYNNVIRKVDKVTGIITTIAGDGYNHTTGLKNGRYTGDNGPATSASFNNPNGLAFDDSDKYLYIADSYNNAIRRVDIATDTIITVAGNGTPGYTGFNVAATSAQIYHPLAVTVDHAGDIYISDQLNNVIRKVDHITGIINTVVGDGYGNGSNGSFGDSTGDGGLATSARLWVPEGIAVDKCNNLYIGDFFNNRVRKVTFAPVAITVNVPSGTICSGSNITLKAYGADSYTWTPSTGLSSTMDSVVTANPTSTITYTVTGTSGCSTASATSVITVNGVGGPIVISPVSPKVCSGQSVSLSVPSGLSNVVWSPSTGLNSTTGDTVIASVSVPTVYSVTASGCVSVGTDTISINATNVLSFTPSSPHVCQGQSVSISVSGGSNFNWSPNIGINQTSGDTVLASLPSSDSTIFTVIGLGLTGCPDTGYVTLRSGGGAIGGNVTAVRDTICEGTPGSLALNGNSSNTIQWQSSLTNTGGYVTILSAPVDTSKYKTLPLTQSTWFRATVGSGNCASVSDSLQLIVPPALTASFTSTVSGQTVTFNSSGSLGNIRSYYWDFGDNQTGNTANPSHTYTRDTTYSVCLTIYDGSNCSYTFCRNVEVNANGVATINASGNWTIYPDPVTDELNVERKGQAVQVQGIEMYDVLGRAMINELAGNTNNSVYRLNVSSLAKGMYYVVIKTTGGDYMQKVMKQ